jgi:hypothetical protein
VIKAEKPTFFIDRALGRKYVADALRNAGAKVEIHEDHFSPDSPDTEWLPEVSQRGWLILTKDDAIGRNILEQIAIASSEVKKGTGNRVATITVYKRVRINGNAIAQSALPFGQSPY